MSSKKGNHPEIGSLIRLKDEMWQALEEANYFLGLRKMQRILLDIKLSDSPEALRTKIKQELNRIKVTRARSKRVDKMDEMENKYWGWGNEVVQILWAKNYLVDEGYGMFYPANMKDEGVYKSPLLSQPPKPLI